MFGALSKHQLSKELGIPRENIVVVCVAPCTAKKFEAARPEFEVDGHHDVDHVITTEELARMIKEHGIEFDNLAKGKLDMPLSFATGGAIIFGSTGGVCEAVLRFAAKEINKGTTNWEFKQFRGYDGLKTGEIEIGDIKLRCAVVSGLSNAQNLVEKILAGEEKFDLVEVMACRGGCVNGGGQPVNYASFTHDVCYDRAQGLYSNDRALQFHASNENPVLQELYRNVLDEHTAHELLHTTYRRRRLIKQDDFVLNEATGDIKLSMTICFGRECFLAGAQELYGNIMNYLREADIVENTEFKARFCAQKCGKGPVLLVGEETIEKCTIEKAKEAIKKVLR